MLAPDAAKSACHPAFSAAPRGADLAMSDAQQPATASALARGICRALQQLGYASLVEFPLVNRRRADILALGKRGDLVIIEIKSSLADFRADRKWASYRE